MKFETLEDKRKGMMYDITIQNLKEFYKEFVEQDDDYEKWEYNCLKNNVILLQNKNKVYAYLMYQNNYICEFQIDDEHKSDGYTFKTLMKKYFEILDDNCDVACHINPFNKRSIKIFEHIGFRLYKENGYKITYTQLEKWLGKEKELV